jgi:hypothetical protein
VLSGDFLLAQASRLVAENAPGISWAFADWLAELARLRAGRLDPGSGVPAAAVFGALFEFPARIGVKLGGSPPERAGPGQQVSGSCSGCGRPQIGEQPAIGVVLGAQLVAERGIDMQFLERVTAEARRAVGQWPMAESLVAAHGSGLAQAAEREPDPQQKHRLLLAARGLGGSVNSLAVQCGLGDP